MAEIKYPPGYAEEFEATARLYTRRGMALYDEHKKNGTPDDEYLKLRLANGDEMLEKLHQVRVKYGVPDPASEDER